MDKRTFIRMIAEITEHNTHELSMDMILDDIEGWNSLAVVTFIATCDLDLGISIEVGNIPIAKTLGDLYKLVVDSGNNNLR